MNGERYRKIVSKFFLTKMQELDLHDMWSKQDNATCYTAHVTMNLLTGEFGEHFISRSGLVRIDRFNAFRLYICGAMLKLMSIQTSPLQLTHWKTTFKHLFVRYRPKCWKEYAKIGLSGWTI